ncbi:erythromycin esterase family protein [Microbispora sp. GKU 823]|uniref:erythromycin esterase family protein n=1 Tax=Microbispora sp. GKU 823 TaxID=1652100 RepID=UPI0009A31B6F|nr:erythromycin esterase family protein [Microbispora sp. GKU 823]OPG13445.1 erythromycin esterase [Microbispora sp. GKU 823]
MDIKDMARQLDGAGISAFLRSLPAEPLLLGLGEARHFVGELGELRNEIFRHLVEHEGYRSFAIESDCLMGLVVDDYIATGTGTLDDVMERGFSHGFGASPANRELVRWMRAYNEEHDEKLRFFGFDGPLEYWAASPRQALTAPLRPPRRPAPPQCGNRGNPRHAAGPGRPVVERGRGHGSVPIDRPVRRRSAAATDRRRPGGAARRAAPQLSAEDRERAALYGRTATGLLRYHYWMADASPARWTRLSALRDAMMAANLRAVAEHGPALVFASNLHLQRNKSLMPFGDQVLEWWSAGAITATHLGDRYAFLASAFGTVADDAPPPNTVEGILSTLPWDRSLVDARRLAEAITKPDPRISRDFAYFPLDPAQLGMIDGVVFLKFLKQVAELG